MGAGKFLERSQRLPQMSCLGDLVQTCTVLALWASSVGPPARRGSVETHNATVRWGSSESLKSKGVSVCAWAGRGGAGRGEWGKGQKEVSATDCSLLFSYLWKQLLLAFKNVKAKHKQGNEKPCQKVLYKSLQKSKLSFKERKKKKKKATSKIKDRNVTWKVKEGGEHFFLEYSLFATITSETRRTLCSGGSHFKFLLQSDHFRAKQINRLKEVLKHAKPGRQGQVWCILRPQNGT